MSSRLPCLKRSARSKVREARPLGKTGPLLIRLALSIPAVKPSLEEFRKLAEQGNVVPVCAQLAADFETPISAFLKIRDGQHAFLFESAESTDASGRWSIVGSGPRRIFEARGK